MTLHKWTIGNYFVLASWQPVLTTLVDEKAHVSAPCHVEKWEKRVLKNVMFRRERCATKTEHNYCQGLTVPAPSP